MPRILVVDDDMFFRKVITKLLTGHGYEIVPVQSGEEALQTLQTQTFDLMISDVNMTPMDGMELLQKTRESHAEMGVIMLTGDDSIDIAIEAMKKGAFDFLVKPFQLDELFATVQRSLEYYNVSPEDKPLQARLDMLEGLVAESAGMRTVCDLIKRIAPAHVTVLLCGETGTEELIARTLHYYSPRKDKSFIAFDCAGLPAPQLEAELFGQGNGSLDNASASLAGVFAAARGGTLFLDHIEALSLDIQSKLLDVIQNQAIPAAGGSSSVAVDVRLVVASGENLEQLVEQGAFHENLYYRLSALRIDIPPLRDRSEDIPFLVDQALRRNFNADAEVPVLDAKAKEILYNYTWPGNMDELEEVIRHSLAFVKNGRITKEMLPAKIVAAFEEGGRSAAITRRREQFKGQSFKSFLHGKQEKRLGQSTKPLDEKKRTDS
jgi:DNA-binding NtrC family response regulator